MSITIPRASSSKSEAAEPPAGGPRSHRREDDFEAFLIMPAAPQQTARPFRELSDGERSKEPPASTSEIPSDRPPSENSPETPIRPESLIVTKKFQGTPSQMDTAAVSSLPVTSDTLSNGETKPGKGTVCQMPEKPIDRTILNVKHGAAGTLIFESIKPSASIVRFPGYTDAGIEGLLADGTGPAPTLDEFIAAQDPAIRPADLLDSRQFKSTFVTADGEPFRPIEIQLKGANDLRHDTAIASPGLYPAGGIDLTPPRLRISFADIANVLRSGREPAETMFSAGRSEVQPWEASFESSGNGTTAFTDPGNPMQPNTLLKLDQTDSTTLTRSIQQMEAEILQLASAANLRNEGRSLKIRLNSMDLGSVEITLVRHESGSMSAHLVTDSESSRQSLNENLAQLRNSLENAGLQLQELDISCRSFSSARQGDSQGRDGDQTGTPQFHSAATQNADGISEANGEGDTRLLNLRA